MTLKTCGSKTTSLETFTVTTPDNAEETSNNVYSLGLVDKMEVKELACKVSWFSGDQTHRFEVLGGTDPEFDVGQLLILDAELNDFYESDLDPFARSVLKVINDGQNSMDADGNTNYFFDAMPLRRDVVNVYLGNAAAQEFDKINGDQMLGYDNKTFSFRTLIMSALKPLQGTEVHGNWQRHHHLVVVYLIGQCLERKARSYLLV